MQSYLLIHSRLNKGEPLLDVVSQQRESLLAPMVALCRDGCVTGQFVLALLNNSINYQLLG